VRNETVVELQKHLLRHNKTIHKPQSDSLVTRSKFYMGTAMLSCYVNVSGFSPDNVFLVLDANRLHPGGGGEVAGKDEWEN
jgi:hypothetical protein